MDQTLSIVTDDGELTWSDSQSLTSDDCSSLILPSASPWIDQTGNNNSFTLPSASATVTFPNIGQLSPISTGTDGATISGPGACGSTEPANISVDVMNSDESLSASADSWSIDPDDPDHPVVVTGHGIQSEGHWGQAPDDDFMQPKLEPLDDEDLHLSGVQEAPLTPVPSNTEPTPTQSKPKRPRGRPRKHPLNPVVTLNKVTKGRSKTGCLTCRKRKKKCDEAKPRCQTFMLPLRRQSFFALSTSETDIFVGMNCEKNAVVCEGYPEKQIWKSGRDRGDEEGLGAHKLPSITLQPLFHGLETTEDRIFWKHYNDHLSAVLTVEGEHRNAFRDLIIPIAVKHQGLMHSILALSSIHIDYETPYGAKILGSADVTIEALQERSDFHHKQAMAKLYEELSGHDDREDPRYKTLLAARYGQILCLLVGSMVNGDSHGAHRIHLGAYQHLIEQSPPEDPALLSFVTEFFQYHVFADELLRRPRKHPTHPASGTWEPSTPIHPPRLLGVADGWFRCLPEITALRDTVRENMAAGFDPVLDYAIIYRATEIEKDIHDWSPKWPPGDSRGKASLLYRQMMWIYLARTAAPPSTSPSASLLSSSIPVPAALLAVAPEHSANSNASSAHESSLDADPASSSSSPTIPFHPAPTPTNHLPPSHTDLDDEKQDMMLPGAAIEEHRTASDSPPPIRLPPGHSHNISVAVEECLDILDSFKPSDPVQALLLIPCLVVGTVCFAPHQQQRIRDAIRVIRGYRGLRNADRASELLEEVWRAMNRGDWLAVWDWQGIAERMGLDFLCS